MFFFFKDPEGSNLLIVTIFALVGYFISNGLYKYLLNNVIKIKEIPKLYLTVFIQIIIFTIIYFCLYLKF